MVDAAGLALELVPLAVDCGIDNWANGSWWDGLFCPVSGPTGLGMAGVGLFFVLFGFVILYNWSGDLTMPAAWLALIFGFAAATLPGEVVRYALSIIVFTMAIGLYAIWRASR